MNAIPERIRDDIDNQQAHWNASYGNHDNYIFYPHEEIIRFFARHVRKRVDIDQFTDIAEIPDDARLIDIGCGIGQHVLYALENGLDAYGCDLSQNAIHMARRWLSHNGCNNPEDRVQQADIRQLPWPDQNFEFGICRGVLDSMHFDIAMAGIREIHRVLKPGAWFYCDLVSGDDSAHAREFDGEEIVQTRHENNTVQSYFNYAKVCRLLDGLFDIEECNLISRENVTLASRTARYHLALKKI